MLRIFSRVLCLLAFVGLMPVALAAPQDPYQLIDVVAQNTFHRMNKEHARIQQEPGYLRQVIREELLPYVDNKFAAYKVIGSNIKNTSPEQRDRFTLAFTDYIVATYADALGKYDNQTIQVEPSKPLGDQKVASVSVKVLDPAAPEITVIFKLRQNSKTGEWKAYDMVAEGISLLAAKQSELGGMIRQQGIDKVSAMLEEHNSKPATLPSKSS
ncbi:phospholipid-binding protein MlaC [Pseudaeromonas paramecii]|uniref:Phospholipid-binding protein MlaC n=1 Tax=Pseudaeromonas paramecii TaxID=2138166 RepID=A0ABP8Q738_9GAMM